MIQDIEGLLSEATQRLRDFADCAVIGMSGGADSTLVATLCALALGEKNVYGIGMPCGKTDVDTFNTRSQMISDKLGINYQVIPISAPVDAIGASLMRLFDGCSTYGEKLSPLQKGNTKARVRMATLYAVNGWLSEAFPRQRFRVFGTGNLSEDFIGYDTKGGDALADIFPIGSLFKSEVYQLLQHFVENGALTPDLVDHTPSAGLWEGQTDEGELGRTYNEMEPHIKTIIEDYDMVQNPNLGWKDPLCDEVAQRHRANRHKHLAPPMINLRRFCEWQSYGHKYPPFLE